MEVDNTKILLSIVVPVYNVAGYLHQCVDSIMNQNCDEIEIILVDDGSTDGSQEICNFYSREYENIKVIHKENGGLVSARKTGVKAAIGKFIYFIDSDDWIGEGYLSCIINTIKNTSSEVISINNYYRVELNGEVVQCIDSNRSGLYNRRKLEKEVFPTILYKEPFYSFGVTPSLCLKVIKSDVLKQYIKDVPNNVTMGEDLCLSLPIFLSSTNVYFLNCCGYYYRMNPSSITHSYDPKSVLRITKLLDYLESITVSYGNTFNLKTQMDVYSDWIISRTLVSLVLGSSDLKKDLCDFDGLLRRDCMCGTGIQELPVKIRILLILAKRKITLIIKILKKVFELKQKLVNIRL